MKIDIDAKTIEDVGFDKYLKRADYYKPISNMGAPSRYVSLRNIKGGLLSSNADLFMGNKQMRFDGRNVRQVVNDGNNDVVIIGKLP